MNARFSPPIDTGWNPLFGCISLHTMIQLVSGHTGQQHQTHLG